MHEIMSKYNIPAGILKTVEENCNDPHWIGRNTFIKFEDQTLGREVYGIGIKPILSDSPGGVWRGAPRLGHDTEMIMSQLLGYSDKEIEAFKGKGIID
jgi:crotonobetainyl-CoA:carnitine CoA-transferase CaiB-like acyl-CoA transferase